MAKMYCFLALLLAYHIKCIACADKPNIVVIVADDLVNTNLDDKNVSLTSIYISLTLHSHTIRASMT